jgi:hypothetical protein
MPGACSGDGNAGYGRLTAIRWRWDPLSPPRYPAALQELLGFNQASDFFGFIAGQSPRDWLAASAGRLT